MLGKLIKHEFKATGKVMIPVSLSLAVITLIGAALLGTRLMQREALAPLAVILLVSYIAILIALCVITEIFLIVHYYRSMFSSQGYLTFTLPFSPWTIFNAKLLVGFLWLTCVSVLVCGSACILIGTACGFENLPSIVNDIFSANLLVDTENAQSLTTTLRDLVGCGPLTLFLLLVLLGLVSNFYSLATGFGSVTVGQLYAKHKVVGAVLAYAILYIVMQAATMVTVLFISFHSIFSVPGAASADTLSDEMMLDMMQGIYQPMFFTLLILQLAVGLACYIASVIIVKRRVNLD